MARASLISQARGERVHSTGTHRRLDVMPVAEPNVVPMRHVCDGPIKCCQPDCSVCGIDDSASFERMMRSNRAVGL